MPDTTPAVFEAMPIAPAKIEAAAKEIDLSNPTVTLSYGAKPMGEIAKFADSILGTVKSKDAGPVGEQLSELMLKVKGIDVEQIAGGKKGSFLASIPVIGSLFSSMEREIAKFDTLLEQVEVISHKLEDAMVGLLKDIQVLEQLYNHNKDFYEDLSAYIQAGENRLEVARNEELPKLEAVSKEDNLAAQDVRDFAEQINRFERRLHDLKLSRAITLQTAPQIRMIQSNDQSLAEKIQTSILATIPIWKNQIVLALSLQGQRNAARLQKEVADTTNEMLRKNAEMLHSSTVETAKEVERSIVDVETMRDVHQKLISTIEETMNIAQNGREQRREVEKELKTMEDELRTRLTSLAVQGNQQKLQAARGK